MKNSGKMTFTGIVMIFLIGYGAFAAIKLISANMTEREISKKIKDTMGVERGYGFDELKGRDVIIKILSKARGIKFTRKDEDNVEVRLDEDKKMIIYYYEYEIVTNLIFGKKRKKVFKEEQIRSYN